MQTECAVCWGAEFPLAGEAGIVGAVAGSITPRFIERFKSHVHLFL